MHEPGGTEAARAMELAYTALSARERTVAEMRTYLERKRVEPQDIEYVVAELAAAELLDDARFAERFAEDKRNIERWGAERIERDLLRRGVAREHVEAAVDAQGTTDELAAALDLLSERRIGPPQDDRERDRVWRMLVRKGYGPELAYEAVRTHGR